MILSAISYLLLIFGSIFYVLYCVKPVDNGPLAKFREFMIRDLPAFFSRAGDKIFGPRFTPAITRAKNYVFFSNNPLVMAFYMLIAPGSFCLYVFEVMIKYYGYFNPIHLVIGNLLVAFAFLMYYKTYATNPGVVTPANAKHYREKYRSHEDGYIFKADEICTTCKTVK